MSRKNRPAAKDMYWFAHGGVDSPSEKGLTQRNEEEEIESNYFMGKNISDRRNCYEEQKSPFLKDSSLTDGSSSSGPASLERDDRLHAVDKRIAVEERRKLLWEAEQERNDAVMKKHMERDAALEAKRNAQRSTISFAFGSSVPRNVDALQSQHSNESDSMSRSFTAGGLSYKGEDLMTRSMTASISAPRGRRKNDLMPTVPYDRTATPRVATSSSSRRRSVSMTRLDQLAQPRKHYVEATKAHSTVSSGASSMLKDRCSPNRPLSSASEHSGGRVSSSVVRRMRSSPRKPRPVSIAGTIPDQKPSSSSKSLELKATPIRRTYTPLKKSLEVTDVKKTLSSTMRTATPKSTDRVKSAQRPSTTPLKATAPKQPTPKPTLKPKKPESKASSPLNSTPKTQSSKNLLTNKKKNDLLVTPPETNHIKSNSDQEEKSCSPPPDSDSAAENDKNGKRIISEEEAKAALAEKRKLAREQAEREAELERQRQEELRKLEEEKLRQEEEEQRKLEEEHLRLIEEHRRQEEEKLRKAIEDQEKKEEEERAKRDEEMRLKAEQEKKAKEEAEKLKQELEEKLRKEEEERAERKKRLEKIMSRTRGKSSGTSPSGSISGSDQLDSGDNHQEGFSSGANSLESNDGRDPQSESLSSDDGMGKMEVSSGGNSMDANLTTYEFESNDVSLNSNDLMLPASETASQDNSLALDKETSAAESVGNSESSGVITPVNPDHVTRSEEEVSESEQCLSISKKMLSSINQAVEIQIQDTIEFEKMKHIKTDNEDFIEKESVEKQNDDTPFLVESTFPNFSDQQLHISNIYAKGSAAVADDGFVKDVEGAENLVEKNMSNTLANDNITNDFTTESIAKDAIQSEIFPEHNVEAEINNAQQNILLTSDIISDVELMSRSIHQELSPFEMNENSLTKPETFADVTSQDDVVDNHIDDFHVDNPVNDLQSNFQVATTENNLVEKLDFSEQPRELGEESLVISKQSLDLQVEELKAVPSNPTVDNFQSIQNDKSKNPFETNSAFDMSESVYFNQNFKADLASGDSTIQPFDSTVVTDSELVNNSEAFTYSNSEVTFAGDNPFLTKLDENVPTHNSTDQLIDNSLIKENLENVTLIKEEGSENYVGIISSIDNDTLTNSFSKPHVQFTNNFECASTTDSEESSLDSNLSQVVALDESDKNVNSILNNIENSVFPTESIHINSNNIRHSDNPFQQEGGLNQSSIPLSNHFSEVYSNGHGVNSSETLSEHLDGNSILCVDHSKNNIFENVDTIDFNKVSQDPFLVKGNSKQIPGNPFLMQDEQSKVLMTSDFLN